VECLFHVGLGSEVGNTPDSLSAWRDNVLSKGDAMKGYVLLGALLISLPISLPASAGSDARANHGDDPFIHVSNAIPNCATPRGPFETDQEWLDEAHYRIERGNSCWIAGRCRLSNGYLYDKEIAESVTRRLNSLNASLQWRDKTSLWLTIQRRFIYLDGCVSRDFDRTHFISALGETADVERVIDRTTIHP
jgi:hypothetical protein